MSEREEDAICRKAHIETSIKTDYFRWLCGLIEGITDDPRTSYRGLLYTLFAKDFYCFVANDANRSSDGIYLRQDYLESIGVNDEEHHDERVALNGPCRMLEMMVALAKRCEDDIMYDPKKKDRTRDWFFVMIKNLGLDIYTDANFNCESQEAINRVLDCVIERTYTEKGEGGLFPLKNPKRDQRKVEIWFQLAAWLDENFFGYLEGQV